MRLSKSHTRMTVLQNYAGSKQNSYDIMRVTLFPTMGKAEPRTGNIRGFNVLDNLTAAQITKLLLQQHILRRDELQKAYTNRVRMLITY
jgi:hypothetical protein